MDSGATLVLGHKMPIPLSTRVRLLRKPTTEPTSLVAGDEGEAVSYNSATKLLQVKWDNGSLVQVYLKDIIDLPSNGATDAFLSR